MMHLSQIQIYARIFLKKFIAKANSSLFKNSPSFIFGGSASEVGNSPPKTYQITRLNKDSKRYVNNNDPNDNNK